MGLLGARRVTVTRVTSGAYVSGVYTVLASTTLQVWASVQPIGDRDRQNLPEGIRTSAKHKLYTTATLTEAGDNQLADTVDVGDGGVELVVVGGSDWDSAHRGGVRHHRYILAEPGFDEARL